MFIDNSFILRQYHNILNELKDIYNGAVNAEQRTLYKQLADEKFNPQSFNQPMEKLLGEDVWNKVQKYREELLMHDVAAFRYKNDCNLYRSQS